MPECSVCGERDFEEHDGHFFCSICNTQSQDVRVIVADEENFDNFRRRGIIREPTTPRQSKKQVTEGDQGRPWSVYEAYQIIIQHQVDALIRLGAQEDLKDIVFQIWVNYLSRLGVAFSAETATSVKYERERDLFPSTTDQPKVKNVLLKKSRKRTLGLSAKKVQEQMVKDQTLEALQNEEFYKEDNPLNVSEEDSVKGDWSSGEEEEESAQRWGRYRKSLKFNAIEKVRMTSTISVCFLGLMFTNPLVTATDLIRWIKKKKIPYLDVRDILPEDMKFCFNDWKLFGFGWPPTVDQLRQTAGTIAYYINLNNFPEFPIDELINKYIIQLDLPAEFHGYTLNLYRTMQVHLQYIPSAHCKKTIFWECIALAYIVISLKFFFGLNDRSEILLSEYTKELLEISQFAQPLFVWTDWVQHMKNKMQVKDQQKFRMSDSRQDGCGKLSERIKATQYTCKITRSALRDSLVQPFMNLSQRWKTKRPVETQSPARDHRHHGNIPINFDVNTLNVEDPMVLLELDVSTQDDTNVWNNQMGHEVPESSVDKNIQSKSNSFRKASVQHIVSPESFLTDIQSRNDRNNSKDKTSETDVDIILSEIFSNDFYDVSSPKRRRLDRAENNSSQRNTDYGDNKESAMHDKIDKYQEVIEKIKDLRQNVETSLDFETPHLCLSYDWLLKICCCLIQCETAELKNMILKLEIMFLANPDDDSLSKKGKYHCKKLREDNQYFVRYLSDIKYEDLKM